MKQSDIFSIILIAMIGMLVATFTCNSLLGDPSEATAKYKEVEPVPNTLVSPNTEVFNSEAINPTVEVMIGDCEDGDGNGIIDEEELKKCHGETVSEEDDKSSEKTEKSDKADKKSKASSDSENEDDGDNKESATERKR